MLAFRNRPGIASAAPLSSPRPWAALLALLAIAAAQPAWAQATCTWNQNGPGQWDNPSNWNDCNLGNGTPSGTPGPADHAVIGNIAPLADIDLGASPRTVDRMTLSAGRVFGNGNLSVNSRLIWTGGTIDGDGGPTQLVLGAGSINDFSGGLHLLAKRDLVNLGNITWVAGAIQLNEDAEIDNQGVFVIDSGGGVVRAKGIPPSLLVLTSDGSPLARIHNSSTPGARIEKNGTGLATFAANVSFDNANDVLVNDGLLQIMGSGSDFGAYQVASAARLEFGMPMGVTRALTGATAVSGSGVLHKFGEGQLDITGDYTLTGTTEVVEGTLHFDTLASPLVFASLRVRHPGILSSPDNLEIGNLLNWEGGEIVGTTGGLTLTLPASATAAITLDDTQPTAFLRSRDLINQGSLTLSAIATMPVQLWLDAASIDNQASFTINNNSSDNLSVDCTSTNCGSFANGSGATLTLNDQAGVIAIGSELTAFNNAGLVELLQGCGAIGAPGVDTGTWRYGGSCTLWFNPRPDTERVLESPVVLDPQGGTSLQLGGTVRANGASRAFGNLIIDPTATLYGPAAISLTGITEWRGLIEGTGLAESITVTAAAIVTTSNNPSDTPALYARTLFNDGSLGVSEVRLALGGNAEIRNNALLTLGGSFVAGGEIGCADIGDCGSITNHSIGEVHSGTPSGAPPTLIDEGIGVLNQGLLAVDNGTLLLQGSLSAQSGSLIDVGPGAVLRRSDSNLVIAAGTLGGLGTIDANLDVDAVTVQPGGPIAGNLSVLGNYIDTASTLYVMGIATATPPLAIAPGSPPPPRGLFGYDRLTIAGSASLAGTLDVVDLGYAPSPSDVFDLMLYASHGGNVVAGANPYSGDGFVLQTEATRIRLAQPGGTACTWNPAGAGADDWTNPAKWDNCGGGVGPGPGPVGTPGASDTAVVSSGLVNLDVPVTVSALQFTGGNIDGPNNLLVANDLIWTGGVFSGGSGTLVTVNAGATASLSGGQHTLDTRGFVLNTAANWTTGLIELSNGAVFTIGPSGTLNSNPNAAFESFFGTGLGVGVVQNDGAIVKLGANASGIGDSVNYEGSGSITVIGGNFIVAAASASPLNASFTADAGGILQFVGGNRSFGISASLGGAGTLVFGDSGPTLSDNVIAGCFTTGANVAIRHARVAVDCASPTQFATLVMNDDAGILEGSSDLSVSTGLIWGHGMIRGTGPAQSFTLLAGASGSMPSPLGAGIPRVLHGRRFVNHASLSWQGENALAIDNGAIFENRSDGQFALGGGAGIRQVVSDLALSPRLVNQGTLTLSDNTPAIFDIGFDNSGSVQVVSGNLALRRDGSDSGSYAISAGASIEIDDPAAVRTFTAASSVSGGGALRVFSSASLTVNGSFAPAVLDIGASGTIALDTPGIVNLNTLTLFSGTLTGNNEVRVTTAMFWEGGSVIGTGATPGPLVIDFGATLDMDSPSRILDKRVLRIEGNATWLGGALRVPQNSSGRITIGEAGLLAIDTIKTTAFFGCDLAPCTAELELLGDLQNIGDDANLQLSSPLQVNGGTLLVSNSGFQTPAIELNSGAVTVMDPGTLTVGSLTLNGGVLSGNGVISGPVDNLAGRVQPGASPGQLDILGSYNQGASGILDIEVAGPDAGVSADFLFASGAITLDGTLNVIDAGYTLASPATLDILLSDSNLSGTFATTNIPYPGYNLSYSGFAATLTPGATAPLVVNSVADPGTGTCDVSECTLREAISQANADAGPDVIEFNIPALQCGGPGGACVIAPASPLPAISDALLIDGYTQPGSAQNSQAPSLGLGSNAVLQIELDGTSASGDGLVVNAPSSSLVVVTGLALYRFANGIVVQGPGDANIHVSGNFIGLRADGSAAPAPAQGAGISLFGGNTLIGGGLPPDVNLIGGNQSGIRIGSLLSPGGVSVQGNLIGTARDGIGVRANQLGIEAITSGQALGILIGGNEPDQRNVIGGNLNDGIRFACTAPTGPCFDGAQVQGNFIGLAADGSPLGNGGDGVLVSQLSGGRIDIGGVSPGAGNQIAFNGQTGIRATGFSNDARISYRRNDIFQNSQYGVDLGGDGRTPNDPGDADVGPNGLLNYPEFTSFTAPGGTSAVIDVILDTPDIGGNYPARVDFYKAIGDQPGAWIGTTTCAAPGVSCPASFAFPAGVTVAADDVVLGIVTDGFGKSSEASVYDSAVTIVSDTPDPSSVGTPYTVTVDAVSSTPFAPQGSVTVSDGDGHSCPITLARVSDGLSRGSCMLPSVTPAALTLIASHTPSLVPRAPFLDSADSETHNVVTGGFPTTTAISGIAPVGGVVVGQPYTVSVLVTSIAQRGMPVPFGLVEVRQLSDGATCTIDLALGSSCSLTPTAALTTAVRAYYLGSGSLLPSQSAAQAYPVARADTAIQIVSDTPDPSLAGEAVVVTVSLGVVAPGAGTPTGEVLVTDGIASCGFSLPNLSCELGTKALGAATLEARYVGDANFNASMDTESHTITVDGADLSISKFNGLRLVPGGVPSAYVLLVRNLGPQNVANARVTDILPPQLGNASWTCSAGSGASCPASGTGTVDALVSLNAGSSLTFTLTVTAQASPEQVVSNTATVTPPPNAPDPVPGNNSATDVDPTGIFGEGFETEVE